MFVLRVYDCAGCQQMLHDINMLLLNGVVEGCHSVAIDNIQVGAEILQPLHVMRHI